MDPSTLSVEIMDVSSTLEVVYRLIGSLSTTHDKLIVVPLPINQPNRLHRPNMSFAAPRRLVPEEPKNVAFLWCPNGKKLDVVRIV